MRGSVACAAITFALGGIREIASARQSPRLSEAGNASELSDAEKHLRAEGQLSGVPLHKEAHNRLPFGSSLADVVALPSREDRSSASYTTGYFVFATCLAAGIAAYLERSKLTDEGARWMFLVFMVFAELTGGAFLFGGIAMHLIDWRGATAQTLGTVWHSTNSEWMYFWSAAVLLAPLGLGAGLALVPTCIGLSGWPVAAVYAVTSAMSVCVTFLEAYLVWSEQLAASAVPSALLGLGFHASAAAACALLARTHAGIGQLALGFGLSLVGYLLAAFTPDTCQDPRTLDACPTEAKFNHNAVFHVFVALGVVLICFGVLRASQHVQKQLEEPVDLS